MTKVNVGRSPASPDRRLDARESMSELRAGSRSASSALGDLTCKDERRPQGGSPIGRRAREVSLVALFRLATGPGGDAASRQPRERDGGISMIGDEVLSGLRDRAPASLQGA